MQYDSIIDVIGATPAVRLRLPDGDNVAVFAKLELQNLFGMKDRVARQIILEARRSGALAPGAAIVESSSGTMALGVALVGRSLGHEVHIVTDPRIDPITMAKLTALGATVHVVETMTDRGWQGARLDRLNVLMAELPGAFWPQQYRNPDNPGAYRELAQELLRDLGHIDVLVGAVGSGGSLCGTARELRRNLPAVRVVAVDSVGSVLFGHPDRPARLQSGLGNSVLPGNLDRTLIDEVHWLNDGEAFDASLDLAAEQQIFAGNTSGSVYRVLRDVSRRAAPGTRLVGILPDRGDRYIDTVFDGGYRIANLAGIARRSVPVQVPYGTVVDAWSYATDLPAPQDSPWLLFIESNTTGSGILALSAAQRLGVRPVLLTSNPDRYQGLAETGATVLVCDTNSRAQLRNTISARFNRDEVAGVTTTSDFYVVTVAELAFWLGLPGNPPAVMARCRDKAAARAVLGAALRYRAIVDLDAVPAAVAHVGLPCVVKPVDDSGSSNVRLCSTEAEVAAQAERVLAAQVNIRGQPAAATALIEEYLDGEEYSVEMFSVGGEAKCVGVTAKTVTGGPYFVETGHLFPAPIPAEQVTRIQDAVRAALDAIGVQDGPTHTELKISQRGPEIIEINGRLAGGMIPELVRLATGVDLLESQLRAAMGQKTEPVAPVVQYAGIRFLMAERAGVLEFVEGLDHARAVPGVKQVVVTCRLGAAVRPPRDAYDRLGFIVAAAATADETNRALNEALGLVKVVLARPLPAPTVNTFPKE